MINNISAIGFEKYLNAFQKGFTALSKGNGSIYCLSGEAGMGKTTILQSLSQYCLDNSIANIFVDCPAPIGSFKVANLQPLLPFIRISEKLINKEYISAKKRFAMNVGMTVLASLQFTDFVFYGVKELGKDWRQYKKEKSSASKGKVNSAIADYFDMICGFADKNPLILYIDDLHFCDAQTVELINMFSENIENIPVMIVFSYKQSTLDSTASPLLFFLDKLDINTENRHKLELSPFIIDEINVSSKSILERKTIDIRFDKWLLEKTYGIPAVVFEYLRYFKKNPPFNSSGEFSEDIAGNEFLPSSMHSAFAQIVENLNEDEKNLLAICSAEGREFTAMVVSNLLQTDVLTTIKRLRSLINKTSIFKSNGAQMRYGMKTTTYTFNQAFYHSYFQNTLEYEEKVALHGHIAALLKQKYNETSSESIRREIAPFLAAHSSESGDEETAKEMLLQTAQNAGRFGSSEIAKEAYQDYLEIEKNSEIEKNEKKIFEDIIKTASGEIDDEIDNSLNMDIEQKSSPGNDLNIIDFKIIRRLIVDDYHRKNYNSSIERALRYLDSNEIELRNDEIAQLYSLLIKSYIELNNFEKAEDYCILALKIIHSTNEPVAECLVLNSAAVLRNHQHKQSEAMELLRQAAQKAVSLPPEIRLLTLSNIALLIEQTNPEEAKKYYLASMKMSAKLGYGDFEQDVFRKN